MRQLALLQVECLLGDTEDENLLCGCYYCCRADKEKKPPVWAYADEWSAMTDVERAVRISYLAGVENRVPKSYPLPTQVGDVVQYDSAFWQYGRVEEIDGDRMLISRPNMPGTVEPSQRWKPIANAVKVVSRRGVERRRSV